MQQPDDMPTPESDTLSYTQLSELCRLISDNFRLFEPSLPPLLRQDLDVALDFPKNVATKAECGLVRTQKFIMHDVQVVMRSLPLSLCPSHPFSISSLLALRDERHDLHLFLVFIFLAPWHLEVEGDDRPRVGLGIVLD